MNNFWGTFSPDEVASHRRLQTLGLSPAIRHYNERSVPGLGGLWFGMPIAWALLGIWLAERTPVVRPLPCANAVEAAVMMQALNLDSSRARGRRKLPGMEGDFRSLIKRGSYITQPYRMSTVEPLLKLGFVQGSGQRFNLYRLAPLGERFLEAFHAEQCQLLAWAQGETLAPMLALGPERPLPRKAAQLLDRQLRDHNECQRRRTLLELGPEALGPSPLAQNAPPCGLDPAHWRDLRSGVALVRMRVAALEVLAKIERGIDDMNQATLTPGEAAAVAVAELETLRAAAHTMLAQDDSSDGALGHAFAHLRELPGAQLVAELAKRDGAVVNLRMNGLLGLGPAGGNQPKEVEETNQAPDTGAERWAPELPRIANLYALADDLTQSLGRSP